MMEIINWMAQRLPKLSPIFTMVGVPKYLTHVLVFIPHCSKNVIVSLYIIIYDKIINTRHNRKSIIQNVLLAYSKIIFITKHGICLALFLCANKFHNWLNENSLCSSTGLLKKSNAENI